MSKKLFLIAGEIAAGKTFAGKAIARLTDSALFDKDELSKHFTESMLYVSGYDKMDREGDFYRNTVLPLEYKTMMVAALDNLAANDNSVVCVAPFIDKLQDESWIHSLLVSLSSLKVDLYVIWVDSDIDTIKNRLLVRSAPKDAWKIANWATYSQGVHTSPPNTPLSFSTLNNASSTPTSLTTQINELLSQIS